MHATHRKYDVESHDHLCQKFVDESAAEITILSKVQKNKLVVRQFSKV